MSVSVGGLETAIHLSRLLLDKYQSDLQMCLLKLDFSNAFNLYTRDSFLRKVAQEFPEILAWVQTCYLQPSELHFGSFRILSSCGIQQGDPLGPLLFSLPLSSLQDDISIPEDLLYLDDETIIGPRSKFF